MFQNHSVHTIIAEHLNHGCHSHGFLKLPEFYLNLFFQKCKNFLDQLDCNFTNKTRRWPPISPPSYPLHPSTIFNHREGCSLNIVTSIFQSLGVPRQEEWMQFFCWFIFSQTCCKDLNYLQVIVEFTDFSLTLKRYFFPRLFPDWWQPCKYGMKFQVYL